MIRRSALGLLVVLLGALAMASGVDAQGEVTLKFAHWLPPKHPLHPDIVAWGKSVEEASGGTLKVAVFPAEQLGKAKDHYDMARDGIADLAWINPGYTPGRFPVAAAGELPFMIANATSGSAAFDEWYRAYAAREMKDVRVCLTHLHDPGTLHAKKKIVSPDEIKGVKVRPAHATMARFVSLLGGSSVQVSAPESREALERGVADAITFPWNSILLFGIDKAVKFHMDAPFYVTTFAWVMNKARYQALSEKQRKVIDDHCSTAWAEKAATGWAKWEAAGRDAIRKMEGHTVYPITAEQLAAWRQASIPLQDSWATDVAKAGYDPKQVMEALRASLRKHNAAY